MQTKLSRKSNQSLASHFEDETKDYRLKIKIRNNRILKSIEASGGAPGTKWCEENGLSYVGVNNLINMTCSPLNAAGGLSRTATKLCEVLGKLPEDLWSNEQLYPLERNFSEIEMSHEQVVALLPQEQQQYLPDFSGIEHAQTEALVLTALSTLTAREQKIIRLRFEEELTYDECGKQLDVTRERIRQIETRALRKLRSPARIGILVDAVDFVDIDKTARAGYKNAAAKYLKEVADGSAKNRQE